MKKQNWFCKLVSRLCNRRKKVIETTLQLQEEKLKRIQFKLHTRVNTDSESYIKYMISTEMAKFLIDNNLIDYSLIEITSLHSSYICNNKMYAVICDFSFYVKPNKDTETYTFDKNTDFNSLSREFCNPDSNFNKNTENENPQIP